MKNFKKVYRIIKGQVQECVVLEDTQEGKLVAIVSEPIYASDEDIYDTREDALYNQLVDKLEKASPEKWSSILKGYKMSKFYDYYMTKLEKEYPEYLI